MSHVFLFVFVFEMFRHSSDADCAEAFWKNRRAPEVRPQNKFLQNRKYESYIFSGSFFRKGEKNPVWMIITNECRGIQKKQKRCLQI